jgi:hypothetical protein
MLIFKNGEMVEDRRPNRVQPPSKHGGHVNLYMPDDRISYTGNKFREQLRGKLGFITAFINGQPGVYSVDFPEMKTEDRFYVFSERQLSPFRTSKKEEIERGKQVEVQRLRKRTTEEET